MGIGGRSKFQTRIPAIKNVSASINKAQPDPYKVTSVPPSRAPTTNPILLDRATTALPSLNFSFGKISGSTPVMAGHQSALRIPNSAPIDAKSQIVGKFPMKEIALIAAKKLPIMSAPPTTRFRL
ncbi:unannotated protein [freshwater metagenome]|uniref:Unannotated protein n=1 Tax=freshwater metagenome TaxID=449393 RepID=A0A6J7HXD6_9ZZZZ